MRKTIDITKYEALAILAVSGRIGGTNKLRESMSSIGSKLQPLVGLADDLNPWNKAASLLDSVIVEGMQTEVSKKNEPVSWGRLTVNE